jgi:HCO3- transporter family
VIESVQGKTMRLSSDDFTITPASPLCENDEIDESFSLPLTSEKGDGVTRTLIGERRRRTNLRRHVAISTALLVSTLVVVVIVQAEGFPLFVSALTIGRSISLPRTCGRILAPSSIRKLILPSTTSTSLQFTQLPHSDHLSLQSGSYGSNSDPLWAKDEHSRSRYNDHGVTVVNGSEEPISSKPSPMNRLIRPDRSNASSEQQVTVWFPSYLEVIDKRRGYQRKTYWKPVKVTVSNSNGKSITSGDARIIEMADSSGVSMLSTIPNGSDAREPRNGLHLETEESLSSPLLDSPAVEPASSKDLTLQPPISSSLTSKIVHSRVFQKIVSPAMMEDVRRRKAVYLSDWTDAFQHKRKVIPAILFLYFSCLAPAISFGTIASQITHGSIGIVEFLLSAGVSGMAYAVLCGQPMALIAPTGLTLAFIAGLFRFCSLHSLPFFPIYSWVGLWTSFFFVLLGLGGSSQLIRFCTRFTDEIFNALLSLNFTYEAVSSLRRNFQLADPSNLTMPFVSLGMALVTHFTTMQVAYFDRSKYFNQKARTIVKDFGPVIIFIGLSILNSQPWLRQFGVPTLTVPNTFQLAGGRNFLVNLNAVPLAIKILCAAPAVLLTALFYMDQNISVRVVNNPDNKLKKSPAYNLDMVALGIITGGLSLVGLPWMCGATVQSVNHVRAMTESRFNEDTGETEIVEVVETRTAPFLVHALMVGTLGLLPVLSFVPIPVVSGVFLFLGRKLMSGNSFIQRIRDMFVEESRLPDDHPIRYIGRKKTIAFTSVQILCLIGLWCFKQNSVTSVFFPGVIGILILIRAKVLPRFFSEDELYDLGDPTPI